MQTAFWQVKPLFFPHWHGDKLQLKLIEALVGQDSLKIFFKINKFKIMK